MNEVYSFLLKFRREIVRIAPNKINELNSFILYVFIVINKLLNLNRIIIINIEIIG